MKLFDGPPGVEASSAPTERAPDTTARRPDGFISTWRFAGHEDLLMVCLYDGSGTYYRARLSPPTTTCTMRNDNGLTRAWCEQP
jgi:hypothetical protein